MTTRLLPLAPLLLLTPLADCLGQKTATSELSNICTQALDPGPCAAAFQRFGFDPIVGDCVEFVWGGCGGNDNNFETIEACRDACGGGGGVACGARAGDTCADAEFCDFPGDFCDWADAQGVCRPRPEDCPAVVIPVCGCDGLTYANLCEAQANGTDAAFSGTCDVPSPTDIVCGGELGQACPSDAFCDFPTDGCDYADGSGICRPRPAECDQDHDPVCGCDGVTYSNLCQAQANGVDAAASGACGSPQPQPAECTDTQRSAILLGGARLFGECLEGCRRILDIVPSVDRNKTCDEVVLEICDNTRDNRDCTYNTGALSPATHAAIRAAAVALQGVALDSVYGCPDCADGGEAQVSLQRPGLAPPTTHHYEFGEPPAALQEADALVQGLIDDLSACTSSSRIQVNPGCTPR
ncbi:MAG: hypothetical protein KC933_30530 [Myxococcales bacterium]|nr:hypothetical protein [Myxococcales bacterium]